MLKDKMANILITVNTQKKIMIFSQTVLNDTDKLVNFLVEPSCEHCYYCGDSRCTDPEVDDDMEALCVDGVKKWLESEDDKND